MKRIAVIGSGIAGLAAARGLTPHAQVTLFEAADRFGGHAHTVDVSLGGRAHGVDIGFTVFDESAAPRFAALLAELGVATAPAEMSFSAQIPAAGIEWSSAGLGGVFAQPGNLLRLAFWNMLGEVPRFNRHAAALGSVRRTTSPTTTRSATSWPRIASRRAFATGTCCRCSAASGRARATRCCACRSPPWRASAATTACCRHCAGRAGVPFAAAPTSTSDACWPRSPTPAWRRRSGASSGCRSAAPTSRPIAARERFDAVVFACHSVDALALLADPSADEREVLGAFHYQRNRAILHTDVGVLPLREAAWAAWNYEAGRGPADEATAVCVHVLVNRLQPLPFEVPVIVSLNPIQEPAAASVQGEFHYAHPIFDRRALAAQERLPALQGRADSWFCGAWTGLGSHEDGLASALAVCAGLAPEL